MAIRTLQKNTQALYFVTFTCYNWLPLIEKTKLYDNIYEWFRNLFSKNIRICGYVIMPNHIHLLIFLPLESAELRIVIGNAKRFMAYEIVKRLKDDKLLDFLENSVPAQERKKGKIHNIFKASYDAKECYSEAFILQKLNYMHKNPVSGKWNLAETYTDYQHSSARFYELNKTDYEFEITNYMEIAL
ncbi:MAG: transposase [Spirosomataceae bacterium]|jgi:REP element-mobilizing transposase RayT